MSGTARSFDAVIIGAGMAGASLGAELAQHMSVLMIEMEHQPGYHATGRSVAFWSESYGGPMVRPLSLASRAFLETPDPDFSEDGFLQQRGAVHIGRVRDVARRDALMADFSGASVFAPMTADQMCAHIPALRPEWVIGLEERSTCDIDVARLHAAYLRSYARHGGESASSTRFIGAQKDGDGWRVRLSSGDIHTGLVINAAGAWADDIARASGVASLGIQPLLRTVVQLRVDPAAPDTLPLVMDLAGRFYFKPVGGGRIWLTPHDEQPAVPSDVAPDELDIAVAIERLSQVVDWRIDAVERKWAGLRSFAPDRLPVYGHDPDLSGFFWFAGQGGFGIQSAPAAARLAAGLILGTGDDPVVRGIDPYAYSPSRLR